MKTSDRTLYKKVGNKYIPCNDPHALDGLANGCWLVKVEKGSTSIRQCIEPAHASADFAYWMMSDKIADVLSKACEARPKQKLLTTREQAALKAFYDVMGEEKLLYFEYPAIQDIADTLTRKIREGRKNL